MIEIKQIVGVDYERVTTAEDFALWLTLNGWPDEATFERDTFLSFAKLRSKWFYFVNDNGRIYCYALTVDGMKVLRQKSSSTSFLKRAGTGPIEKGGRPPFWNRPQAPLPRGAGVEGGS